MDQEYLFQTSLLIANVARQLSSARDQNSRKRRIAAMMTWAAAVVCLVAYEFEDDSSDEDGEDESEEDISGTEGIEPHRNAYIGSESISSTQDDRIQLSRDRVVQASCTQGALKRRRDDDDDGLTESEGNTTGSSDPARIIEWLEGIQAPKRRKFSS
ncbi:hypothetical protein BJ138DRAFT_1145164 [Hygrophoropsis aurantiaca]|uniref:Uncharacterized protein n=1 Tax=Hygrophoropsis aurantiaca TaxID=72124 RepID=A0ACB8ALR9_9AGAM|nr:hypothetical protein BJ138DRAFT_1145164 [Hygrophoropsis aurantiaca]